MSYPDSDHEDEFKKFMYTLVLGDYAAAYECGWDDCMHGGWKKGKQNPYSNRAYPQEHKAYSHGFDDAILIISEWEKTWRKRS